MFSKMLKTQFKRNRPEYKRWLYEATDPTLGYPIVAKSFKAFAKFVLPVLMVFLACAIPIALAAPQMMSAAIKGLLIVIVAVLTVIFSTFMFLTFRKSLKRSRYMAEVDFWKAKEKTVIYTVIDKD